MSFENTRFIIVGAACGIGSALSRRLKRLGAEPVLMGRTADKLAELGKELDVPTQAVDASNAAEFAERILGTVLARGPRCCDAEPPEYLSTLRPGFST